MGYGPTQRGALRKYSKQAATKTMTDLPFKKSIHTVHERDSKKLSTKEIRVGHSICLMEREECSNLVIVTYYQS